MCVRITRENNITSCKPRKNFKNGESWPIIVGGQ